MAAKMYYDDDADLAYLEGKTIAIIGYGIQGGAQAHLVEKRGTDAEDEASSVLNYLLE